MCTKDVCPGGCMPRGVTRMSAQGCVCLEVSTQGEAGSAQGAVCPGRGVCLGVSAWGVSTQGCLCLPGVSVQGGGVCLPRGCLPSGGCLPGGCLPWGCLPRGMPAPVHAGIHTSLVDRMTDACENITLSQLHCGW